MIQHFDITVFHFINHSLSNPVFNFIMPLITRLGTKEFVIIIGLALLFSKKKETKRLGILLIAGIVLSYFAVNILKHIVARPRPFVSLKGVILLGHASKDFSFPSGHATLSFATASLFAYRYGRYIIFYLLAALVCFSRIYVGVHYPTDVIGGAIVGIVIGLVIINIAKLANFSIKK
jgi:undecaprenyl-diphosphatase